MRNAHIRFKGKEYDNHRDAAKLLGPVKQLMQTTYRPRVIAGKLTKGPIEVDPSLHEYLNYHITYNKKGIKVAERLFGKETIEENTYRDDGKSVTLAKFINGIRTEFTELFYDEHGNNIECKSIDADGMQRYHTYTKYNEQNLRTEHFHYRKDDNDLVSRQEFTYTDKGLLLSFVSYDDKGEIESRRTKSYDEQDNEIEALTEYFTERMKQMSTREVKEYNKYNHCVQQNIFHLDGRLKNTYRYNYEYDKDGNRTDLSSVRYWELPVDGQTEQTKLDEHGNWIEKVTFQNKIPTIIEVREFVFHGAPDRELIHPLTLDTDEEPVLTIEPDLEMAKEDAQWLTEKWANIDQFPIQQYYAYRFSEIPSVVRIHGPYIELLATLKKLKAEYNAQMVHSSHSERHGYEVLNKYVLIFPYNRGYLLQSTNISYQDESFYHVPSQLVAIDDEVAIGSFTLLRPSELSGKRDQFFEECLRDIILSCTLKKREEKPKINIVEIHSNQYVLVEHSVSESFSIQDLDVNYGHGFEGFHNKLMKRFYGSTKGLVLFHGVPGTGKTYYIRHLLKEMATARKPVIYMPPNMVDHLTDPSFLTFLTNELKTRSRDGHFCVLLIEDAEPLLAKRQEGVRIQGVTNLLNMTDGLLNDMLNLQIICTFNVDLKKLDSALLRPGRLVARKEFKALSELDANLLAQRLGVKHHFTAPATLGEIYALRKDSETLIHDVEQDKGSSSLLDDLI